MPDADLPPDDVPTDAEGWRARLAALSSRDLLRLLQKDRDRAPRILSGFRATPDALRRPLILSRIAEEAVRDPQFARDLAELPVAAPPAPRNTANTAAEAVVAAPLEPEPSSPDPRLKDKIREQRAVLREREAHVAVLLAEIAALQRERDAARAEADAARTETKAAEAEAERLRRRQQRDERRASAPSAGPAEPARGKAESPAPADLPVPPPTPWDEALRRLLNRGKPDVVAEVCREALLAPEGEDAGRAGMAVLHTLYAQALRAQGHAPLAAEQERRAAAAHLDAGNVVEAAESFAHALAHGGGDVALLRRLLLLARRTGREEPVRAVFGRLRGTDREVFRGLSETIAAFGGRFAAFVQAPAPPLVGPDELIALPAGGLFDVTPRRLVAAVDANDAPYVLRARAGLAALRDKDAPLAEALLEAVARLEPSALTPFSGPTRAVVVDASNVARHDPDPLALAPVPRVGHLRRMRAFLLRRGFFPILMLADANLRFHVDDRDAYLSLVARGTVQETLPGTSADGALIAEATERGAPLVTNDRLAEWEQARDVERISFALLPEGVVLSLTD